MKTYINLTTVLFACYAALTGYFVFTSPTEIDFRLNWNIFDSFLMVPLYIVGLVVSFGIKFPEMVPVIKWINPDTGKTEKIERNDDIIEYLLASIVMPLLQFFVLVPLVVAALIYYPLMYLIWLFGYIFPLFICIFYIITLVIYYKWEIKLLNNFKRDYAMPLLATGTIGMIWFFSVNWIPDPDKAKLVTNICAGFLIVISTVSYIVVVRKHKPPIPAEVPSGAEGSVENAGTKKQISPATLRLGIIYSISFLILFIIVVFFKNNDLYYSGYYDRTFTKRAVKKELSKEEDRDIIPSAEVVDPNFTSPDFFVSEKKTTLPVEFRTMNDWKVKPVEGRVKKISYDNDNFVELMRMDISSDKKTDKKLPNTNLQVLSGMFAAITRITSNLKTKRGPTSRKAVQTSG